MSDEDDNDATDMRREWMEHPYTKGHVSVFTKDYNEALVNFRAAAAKSSDPEVRAAYTRFKEREVMLKWLTAVPK